MNSTIVIPPSHFAMYDLLGHSLVFEGHVLYFNEKEKQEKIATVLKVIAAIIAAVLGAFGADAMVR